MSPEGITITQTIQGFKKVRFSLTIFSKKKDIASAQLELCFFYVPELGNSYVLERHLWLLYRHHDMEIVRGWLWSESDRSRWIAELNSDIFAVHHLKRIF